MAGCFQRLALYYIGMKWTRFNHVDLLRYAGLFTLACVGIPLVYETLNNPELLRSPIQQGWALSFFTFGVCYWWLTRNLISPGATARRLVLLLAMNMAAVALGYFSFSLLPGILLLVISGVLPWILPNRWGVVWLVLQYAPMVPMFHYVTQYSWLDTVLQSVLYLGISIFTFVTSLVARDQADAREDQRRLNSELRATRALLAESSRIAERVRISRELHDLVGHHLAALTLNLEVVTHLVEGKAYDHVIKARSVAKLLLSDVREVVSQLRHDDEIDLTAALRSLVEGVPKLTIHLNLPEQFAVSDPRRANVVIRCTQEIITNTVKHARARNLWLHFERDNEGGVTMQANDDGVGTDLIKAGNGLMGMEERIKEVGGSMKISTARGSGFCLDARIPLAPILTQASTEMQQ